MSSHNAPPCLFCKKKTQKKTMTMARTFQACETIVQTATVKGEEDILRVTGAVNNDLVAAEARYHTACHATHRYISKNKLHYEGRQETSYDVSFQKKLPEYMSIDLDGGKAFEISTVIGRYKDYLNEQQMSRDSYTTRRLKLRPKKHFGDNIAFHQP